MTRRAVRTCIARRIIKATLAGAKLAMRLATWIAPWIEEKRQ